MLQCLFNYIQNTLICEQDAYVHYNMLQGRGMYYRQVCSTDWCNSASLAAPSLLLAFVSYFIAKI
jgi:hypothetical protein